MGGCKSKPKTSEISKVKNQISTGISDTKLQDTSKVHPDNQNNKLDNSNNSENEKKFQEFLQTIKTKNSQNIDFNDLEILNHKKNKNFEKFQVFNKKSSKFFFIKVYVFDNVNVLNDSTKKEVLNLYDFYIEINKLSFDYICKFTGVDIKEKYIAFMKEDGNISLINYIYRTPTITIQEINYCITKALTNYNDIENKLKATSIYSDALFDILILEQSIKITFDLKQKEPTSTNNILIDFFTKINDLVQKSALLQQNKDYPKFIGILKEIIEKKINNSGDICKAFSKIEANKPTINLNFNDNEDKKLRKIYSNTSKFFEFINNNELFNYYKKRASELAKNGEPISP